MKSPQEKLILAAEQSAFSSKLHELLLSKGYSCDHVFSGKDTQALLYQNSYHILLLDLALHNFSSIEILKYIKLSKISIRILVFCEDKKLIEDLGLTKSHVPRLGLSDFIFPNGRPEKVLQKIEELTYATSWKKIERTSGVEKKEEVKILDRDLTRLPIQEALSSQVAIFDHFIKLASNKYVKVVHQGETFPLEVIQNYAAAGCEHLYFRTKDRLIYINFMNELSQKLISTHRAPANQTLSMVKNITDKYIEEVHTKGIRPDLVDEGKKLCHNVYKMITADSNLNSMLNCMHEMDHQSFSHSFLVMFYSTIISKNIDWVGPKVLETIAIGSLLHDIGTINLPPNIRDSGGKNLNPADLIHYQEHPRIGAEMLQNFPSISEQVRQIIYQHHETINGLGYPNGLTGLKIYPLAKIVALADAFTDMLIEKKLTPKETLKELLMNREEMLKYDPNILRALVYGMTKKE